MNNRIFLLIISIFLVACKPNDVDDNASQVTPENDHVLVEVNGKQINEKDLEAAIVHTLGEYASFQLDDAGRGKVLKSLVLSKAMALTQEKRLTAAESNNIDRMVQAYREELLVKQYLNENVVPIPVTSEMVEEYYNNNPERFGGKSIRTFEVVKGLTKIKGPARNKIIASITELSKESDWKKATAKLKQTGVQVEYSKGALSTGTLKSDIDKILQNLPIKQSSTIQFVDGLPMVVRVVSEKNIAPKPLALVSNDIKKSLAPLQLKKAVKQVSDELMKSVTVTYTEAM